MTLMISGLVPLTRVLPDAHDRIFTPGYRYDPVSIIWTHPTNLFITREAKEMPETASFGFCNKNQWVGEVAL